MARLQATGILSASWIVLAIAMGVGPVIADSGVHLVVASADGSTIDDAGAAITPATGARDIVVVLDFSASMCYDSQLRTDSIRSQGPAAVEAMLTQIYQDLGSPSYGKLTSQSQRITSTNYSTILNQLGLTNVPYPYPQGSWAEYFSYVQGAIGAGPVGWGMDSCYQYRYNYKTFVSYLQAWECMAGQTPDLWKTHEQPASSVKDSLAVLLASVQQGSGDDRVGLVLFTAADNTATLEVPLTGDFALVQDTANHRQAGHYNRWTNIAAGLAKAFNELQSHGRSGVSKMIVLLSDGVADMLDNGRSDYQLAPLNALDVAHQIGAANIPVVPISLGVLADTRFMQQIADVSQGTAAGQGLSFVIRGDQPVSVYREQLMNAFASAAMIVPLPNSPSLPSPGNGQTRIGVGSPLQWSSSAEGVTFDVYLALVDTPMIKVASGLTTPSFTPSVALGTRYYWQVVARNDFGQTNGPIWVFATRGMGDIDGDGSVTLADFKALVAAWNATPSSDNWNPNADIDADSSVGLGDLKVVVARWNKAV